MDLQQCVPVVPCVPSFLSCLKRFLKTLFYFVKRTLTQIYLVHMVHTTLTRMVTDFIQKKT